MNGITIHTGDCRQVLKTLPDNSVHCCVTSPPYWGLRDYGCDGQIGLEQTPDAFVAEMVAVFREVRRVLRGDGTCWLNLGDSYCNTDKWGGGGANTGKQTISWSGGKADCVHKLKVNKDGEFDFAYCTECGSRASCPSWNIRRRRDPFGLKPKDLVGIPWRVAFALQSDGWWLRQEIIWHKPAPMPESVTDRCTKAHEHIFLFVKGQWKSRVIQGANIDGELFHFGQCIGGQVATTRKPITRFCIRLATAIFDSAQLENNFSLPPFYAKEWEKISDGTDGKFIGQHPRVHRLAGICACFLSAKTTAKQFVQQMHCLWLDLGNSDELLVGGVLPFHSLPPSIYGNTDRTVTVHDAGEICKFDFCHNQIVLSTASTCNYYFDADAIKEAMAEKPHAPGNKKNGDGHLRNDLDTERMGAVWGADETRNKRSVWTVATSPYKGAHFATFPPDLIRPCILAGTSEQGVCAACGAPHERVTEREQLKRERPNEYTKRTGEEGTGNSCANDVAGVSVKTLGWQPTCECDADVARPVVLDPFFGSGTTGQVARECGCECIGIDLNPEYVKLAKKRNAQQVILS